jgi:hypothetical protein
MYCKVKGNTPLFVVLSSKGLDALFVRDMPFQNLKNSLNCYQTLWFVVMYSSFFTILLVTMNITKDFD